jgi:hypothetical protein
MNSEHLKDLLIETRDAIKQSLDGSESRKEIIDRYKRIHEQYSLAVEGETTKNDAGIIRGILLYCNSENFSKLTALHSFDDGSFRLIDHYGDKNLLDGLQDLLEREIDHNYPEDLYEVKISEKENLLYMLYCSIRKTENRTVLLSSISSSHYFEKRKFIFASEIIGNLFSLNTLFSRSPAFDFFSDMLNEIDTTIREWNNGETEILGYYYIFKSIEDIFKNSSFSTYSELNSVIINMLKNHHGSESKIYILSLTRFLVLEPNSADHDENSNIRGKVNIVYNELPLPYENIILDFSEYTSIQNIWEKISLFTSYVIDGDFSL